MNTINIYEDKREPEIKPESKAVSGTQGRSSSPGLFESKPITRDLDAALKDRAEILNISFPVNYDKYTCGISTDIMFDPVRISTTSSLDGNIDSLPCHNFERTQIIKVIEAETKAGREARCPYDRKFITSHVRNDVLKQEITHFLEVTRNQLQRDIETHPTTDVTGQYDNHRKGLIILINDFLKYGIDENLLTAKYKKFLENLRNGQFRDASVESIEVSKEASTQCSIL